MPTIRPPYYELGVYHIYNRGVAKLDTFRSDADYRDFHDILRYYLIGFPAGKDRILPLSRKADPVGNGLFTVYLRALGFCLMPNHFHLLLQLLTTEGNYTSQDGRIRSFQVIPEFMKRVCITYTQKFNYKYSGSGAVFQGKYKIKEVPKNNDVLQVVRYMHINPVVAGIVTKPENWIYSDYNEYISSTAVLPSITHKDLILSYFNNKTEEYRTFIGSAIYEQEGEILKEYMIDVIT